MKTDNEDKHDRLPSVSGPSLGPANLSTPPEVEGYEILRVLGEGGMGVVYLARQQVPVQRQVALKIVKPGMDSKQVVTRFESERQALALLDHPNIAQVYDAGTTKDGHPYFSMEYVSGSPITEYCDKHRLSIEERLKLFIQICEGVQHAHQKGIIHRDIKPSNVLVYKEGDKPLPKIIDFGIAKALIAPLTEKTFFTEQGQLLGTPEYMSPEQAEMTMHDIDTRSDIYSLGVVLYELLTGALPFERRALEQIGFEEILKTIREQDPPRPSIRLSSLGKGTRHVAEARKTSPNLLSRLVRGDLDWVVMKSLEKEPNRRYDTAAELAADIRRHLKSEPVQAGPPTASYKLGKFVKRHRVAVLACSLVLVALVVGLAVATYGLRQAVIQSNKVRRSLYIAQIPLVQREWTANNVARAEEILAECDPPLRNWEWYYLHRLCHTGFFSFSGHRYGVTSATFSPDGKWLASTSLRELKIWDVATCKELHSFDLPGSWAWAVVFSRDGKRMAAAAGNVLRMWDVETNEEILSISAHELVISSVAFSPDGTKIASSSGTSSRVKPESAGEIRIWDSTSGERLLEIRDTYRVNSVAFSPDGELIASGSGDLGIVMPMSPGDVKLWNVTSGELVRNFQGHDFWITDVAFSPDGTRLVSASYDKTVRVWNVDTGAQILNIPAHLGLVRSVKYSPDGRYIASCSNDRTVKIWDAKTGYEVLSLRGHRYRVRCVAFSPDCKRLVSAGGDGTRSPGELKVWDIERAGPCQTLRCDSDWTRAAAISPDGTYVAIAGWGHSRNRRGLTIRNMNTGEQVVLWPYNVSDVKFSPDGTRVAATCGLFIQFWEVGSWKEVLTARISRNSYVHTVVEYAPQGNHIAANNSSDIVMFDTKTGAETLRFTAHDYHINTLAFSPSGKYLVSTTAGGWIQREKDSESKLVPANAKVWNAANGDLLFQLPQKAYVAVFSPDGDFIATGDDLGEITIWDAKSGEKLRVLSAHSGRVSSIVFSPDSTRLFSGSLQTVKVWDMTIGREILTLLGHKGSILRVTLDSGGYKLVSVATDGTVKIWDASLVY